MNNKFNIGQTVYYPIFDEQGVFARIAEAPVCGIDLKVSHIGLRDRQRISYKLDLYPGGNMPKEEVWESDIFPTLEDAELYVYYHAQASIKNIELSISEITEKVKGKCTVKN